MRKSLLIPLISLVLIIGCAGLKPEPVKGKDLSIGSCIHQKLKINI